MTTRMTSTPVPNPTDPTLTNSNPSPSAEQIHVLLDRWRHEGLLDARTAARIEAAEAGAPIPAARVVVARPTGSLIAEALGYAGGALILAALANLLGRSWADLAFGAQVALTAGASVLLFVTGALVPSRLDAAGRRLQAVLWTLSTGVAFGLWMLVGGADGFGWTDRQLLVFAGGLAGVQAGVLWWRSRAVLLHLATFAALAVLVAGLGQYLTFVGNEATRVGLALCVFSAVWVLLGVVEVVAPQLTAYLVGTFVAVTGAQATTSLRWGAILAVVVASGVIAFAVWRRSLPLLAVGTYGLLGSVIAAADKFFPGSMAVALGLLVAGFVLVTSGLWITKRGTADPAR